MHSGPGCQNLAPPNVSSEQFRGKGALAGLLQLAIHPKASKAAASPNFISSFPRPCLALVAPCGPANLSCGLSAFLD